MNEDINLELFNRFRLVYRLMRMGWMPDRSAFPGKEAETGSGENACVHLMKREGILTVLALAGKGVKQRDIAELMYLNPSTVSEMVNRLVEDGYAVRISDPNDRRVKLLVLTEKGQQQAQEILREMVMILERLFCRIDQTEKRQLIRLLDRLLGREAV